MSDPLLAFVAESRNFGFLAGSSLELAGDGATAEAYVHTDPDAAVARARRFGETVVDLMSRDLGVPAGPRATFARRIEILFAAGKVPPSLRRNFDVIRTNGNKAAHDYLRDPEKAAAAVEACYELGRWWYRLATGREIAVPFAAPEPGATSRELLAGIDRRLGELRAALDARAEPGAAPVVTIGAAAPDPYRWSAGSIVADHYLVHEPVSRFAAEDGSWTVLEADGHSMDDRAEPVRLRALLTVTPGASASRMAEGLTAQAAYARRRYPGLPRLRTCRTDGPLLILVTTRPAGTAWQDAFGGGFPDPLVVPLAVDALAGIADTLAGLHRGGQAHRALNGESILVAGRRAALRDLGLAWWPPLPGEGGELRAPEQRALARGRAGPATDVYQLAALLRRTCGGIPAGPGPAVPLSPLLPGFPAELDALLGRALDPEPGRRPDAAAFAAGLRQGRRLLVTGAPRGD